MCIYRLFLYAVHKAHTKAMKQLPCVTKKDNVSLGSAEECLQYQTCKDCRKDCKHTTHIHVDVCDHLYMCLTPYLN